jgi:predicted aspartyl protease
MQISGEWSMSDDGIERPVIHGRIRAGDGSWVQTPFLVDTGADRTVISADILVALSLPPLPTQERIGGVGGLVNSIVVETVVQLFREHGGEVIFRGQFAAVTDAEALDMSVLGRDIMSLFAVVVDQPGRVVCLVGHGHRYVLVAE